MASAFEGVFLPWSWFVRGHSGYGRLAICEDCYQAERVVPGCRCLQCSRKGRTFRIVSFLAPAHVGPVTFPGVAGFPDDGVSSCSVLQTGSVRKDGEPWSAGLLGLADRCLGFLDGGGCVQGGGYLKEKSLFPAVPTSQVGL